MARNKTEAFERSFRRLGEYTRPHHPEDNPHGDSIHTEDCRRITELVWTYRDEYPEYAMNRPDEPDGSKPKQRKKSTLDGWLTKLIVLAATDNLSELDERGVNTLFGKLLRGDDYAGRSRTKGTVALYQHATRRFYRVHSDLGVNDQDLILYDTGEGSKAVDPSDMLTRDEIQKADAVAARHDRDYAIWNTLLYTGMRNTCLRTLRWQDVNLEDGEWRPNQTVEEGLKSFHAPNEWRPLLGAKGPLLAWRKEHVEPEPDAMVFTNKPKWSNVNPYEEINPRTVGRVMDAIKEGAGIEKPMNPHMMRHNFVTICKLEKELPDDTVKWLIGHSPESDVMNTTYAHISGDDHSDKAQIAFGYKDEKDTAQRLTPDVCKACERHLNPDFKLCPHCGVPYDHEAAERKEDAENAVHETKGDAARAGDEEGELSADDLQRLMQQNPDAMRELMNGED